MKPNFTSVNDLGLGTAPFFANSLHASLDASSLTVLRNRLDSEKFLPAKLAIRQLYTPLILAGLTELNRVPTAGRGLVAGPTASFTAGPTLQGLLCVPSQSFPFASAASHRLHQRSTNRIRLQVGISISSRDNQSLQLFQFRFN